MLTVLTEEDYSTKVSKNCSEIESFKHEYYYDFNSEIQTKSFLVGNSCEKF